MGNQHRAFNERGHSHDQRTEYPSIEVALLLACARTHLRRRDLQNIQWLLTQDIDWPVLMQLARRHGISPLLYQNLKRTGEAIVDDLVLTELRNFCQGIAFQNAVFTRSLLQILNLFTANDILALPFKGPVLAASAYQNLSLRSFCDLDILVRKQDCLKAIDVLTNQDQYKSRREWHFLNQRWEQLYLQSSREISLTNGVVAIDLHQELTVERYLSSQFSFEDLWKNHESVVIGSQTIPNFAEVDLLLYLCVHASKECWRKLKWICDITEFIHMHPALDWQTLLERARVLHCERRVLIGLLLSQNLLSLALPDLVIQRANQDHICYGLAHEFYQRLFWEENLLGRQFTREKLFLHLKSLENPMDRFESGEELIRQLKTIFIKLIPNSEDEKFLLLPSYLYFLYYLIRPLRLLSERLILAKE